MNPKSKLMLLERVAKAPVEFVYEASDHHPERHARLVRSSISPSQRKHLRAFALEGLVSEHVDGCKGRREPPTHTITYSITSLGLKRLGHAPAPRPSIHRHELKSEAQLAEEGLK